MFSRARYADSITPALLLGAGCGTLDKMDRKMDMASEHMGSDKPVYEGTLSSSKAVGALTSLEFTDGKLFEVAKAPSALTPGDVIRIYKTDTGYEAHLWKASPTPTMPAATPPTSPTPKYCL